MKVVDEIELYVKTKHARNFPFQDLTAILKKDWIIQFCNEILKRELSITWLLPTGTRLEAVDEQVAHLLKRSGMVSMAFAPESGSEATRIKIRKRMLTNALFDSISATGKADLNIAVFIVLGFPHETKEDICENYAFIESLKKYPVSDLSIGSYMALPGTELFDSLYDAGNITINRSWFRSILDGNVLLPSMSWNSKISRYYYFATKIMMYLKFYVIGKRRHSHVSFFSTIVKVFRGALDRNHSSRLQTALSNALKSGIDAIKAKQRKPWMSVTEEKNLFASWDAIYRNIREQRIETGIAELAPSDSNELHKRNIAQLIRREHAASFVVEV